MQGIIEGFEQATEALFGQQIIGSTVQMNMLLSLGMMGLSFGLLLTLLIVLLRPKTA